MSTNKQNATDELTTSSPTGRLSGVLGLVERVGNKLPNPFLLFVGLLLLIAVASTIVAAFHVTVNVPGVKEAVPVRGALAPDGLVALMDGAVDNFVSFPALGPVLVVVLGVGVAQGTGGLEAAVRLVFSRVPRGAVYADALELHGVTTMAPDADEQRLVMAAIAAVKAGTSGPAEAGALTTVARALADRGAEQIVAACTEIVLALGAHDVGLPVVDPARLLAHQVVEIFSADGALGVMR